MTENIQTTIPEVESPRKCVVCQLALNASDGKNATTHRGECRKKHFKSMIESTNEKMKMRRIIEILGFLEGKLGRGIVIENLARALVEINIRNIPFDDFVMTAYYMASKEVCKTAMTIDDIEKAAVEWDEINGSDRIEKYKEKISKNIERLEKTIPNLKSTLNKKRMKSKISKYSRMLETRPKIGFNNNAYKILQDKLKMTYCGTEEETKSMIRRVCSERGIDNKYTNEMLKTFEMIKNTVTGKSSKITTAGILYYVSSKYGLKYTQDAIADILNVSQPSIRDVYNTIAIEEDKVPDIRSASSENKTN